MIENNRAIISGFKTLQKLSHYIKPLLVNIYIVCPDGGRIGKCG
jgi:hypothetical protein